MRWLNGITDSMDMSLNKLRVIIRTGKAGMLQFMGSQRIGHDLATEQQLKNAILGFTISRVQRGIQYKLY